MATEAMGMAQESVRILSRPGERLSHGSQCLMGSAMSWGCCSLRDWGLGKSARNERFPPTWMHTLWRERAGYYQGGGFGLENFQQDTWRPREISGEGALQAGSRHTSAEVE